MRVLPLPLLQLCNDVWGPVRMVWIWQQAGLISQILCG